jgi:hypothetical protein
MDESKPVRMYDPRIMQVYERKIKQKKAPTYNPIADGFITTSGNAERGAKWGNIPSIYPTATSTATTTANLIGTTMGTTIGTTTATTTAMLNKKAE